MSSEPLDGIGATRLKFFYFDEHGELSDTRAFPKLILSPTIQAFPGDDSLSDVSFSIGAVSVMRGRADRSWVPETFSSYRIEDTSVRVAAHQRSSFRAPTAFLSLLSPLGRAARYPGSGLFVIDPVTGQLRAQAHVDWA